MKNRNKYRKLIYRGKRLRTTNAKYAFSCLGDLYQSKIEHHMNPWQQLIVFWKDYDHAIIPWESHEMRNSTALGCDLCDRPGLTRQAVLVQITDYAHTKNTIPVRQNLHYELTDCQSQPHTCTCLTSAHSNSYHLHGPSYKVPLLLAMIEFS